MGAPRKCVTTQARAAERPCLVCGVGFTPRRPWQRHCAPRCRHRAYIERHIAAAVAARLASASEASS